MRNTTLLVLTVVAGTLFGQPGAESAATGAARSMSGAEQEEFLRTAKVVATKEVKIGVTDSKRLTLTNGEVTHDAQLQTIDVFKPFFRGEKTTEANFRDSYKYNIAAYKLDRLLGLNMIPVSVERKIGGDTGAVTWWVDRVFMMEGERIKKKVSPPDQDAWDRQMYRARVFTELVYNTDPNLGNFLITFSWKIWMIDFTRAFRTHTKIGSRENLTSIDSEMFDGLRNLKAEDVQRELGPYLREKEIEALLARRDQIVKHFEKRMAKLVH